MFHFFQSQTILIILHTLKGQVRHRPNQQLRVQEKVFQTSFSKLHFLNFIIGFEMIPWGQVNLICISFAGPKNPVYPAYPGDPSQSPSESTTEGSYNIKHIDK